MVDKIICKICGKKFELEESLIQHTKSKHSSTEKIHKPAKTKYFIIGILIVTVFIFSYTLYLRSIKPGQYDDFAKCLTTKGVVIYGNDFCQYTNKQLNMFGKSKKYLNYVKCTNNEKLCDNKRVDITPTWEINGQMYEQVQSFEKLASLSGCEI